MTAPHTPVRCGIILAGGEGERLRPFIRQLRGDILPKQYVNFIGTRSMLEHTWHRAQRLIPPERLFTVVSRNHLSHPEVRHKLSSLQPGKVVVQPVNKDTGPGILLPLMHVCRRFPDSIVVVFPSDHFIVEEDLFMAHVDLAFRVVEQNSSCLVLLGVQPCEPELEYGYIVPGKEVYRGLCEVSRFIEKPDSLTTLKLIQEGGLWNTMVIISKVGTLVDLVHRTAPQIYRFFEQILGAIGTTGEADAVNDAYRHMEAVNFSKGLLEPFSVDYAARLKVLPVRGVYWSDWGSERRIMSVLQDTHRLGRLHGIPDSKLSGFGKGLAAQTR
jgi:mannose-1-phosphate guanylyltransferase